MRAAIAALVASLAFGVTAGTQQTSRPLAIEQLQAPGTPLTVTSPAFTNSAAIPLKYADYGEKVSPEVSWSGASPNTKSLAVLVEDPDAREPKPFVHWVIYNLPPSMTGLPESIPGTPRLPEFGGALQGRNDRGTIGYFGPRPPKGDPPHRYRFQVFAADVMLSLDPGATATAVIAALKGHVVGRGELIGTFTAPTP